MSAAGSGKLAGRERAWTVVACVVGVALMAVAVWLVAGPVAVDERSEAAFRAAQKCPSEPARQSPECVSRRDAVIRGVREISGKTPKYWVGVPGEDGKTDWIRLKDTYSFSEVAHEGDPVALYSWKGKIRGVVTSGISFRTADTPLRSWGTALGWATGLFPGGLAVLCCGLWWRLRGAAHGRSSPWQISVIGLAGILSGICVGVWVPIAPDSVGAALRGAGGAYAVALLGALCCWAYFSRKERRQGDDIAITPRPGPAEQVINVFLPHEPEYSGKTHLVVQPGSLAMSPDPTGRVARRPLPDGLTLVRVRHQLRTGSGPLHQRRPVLPPVLHRRVPSWRAHSALRRQEGRPGTTGRSAVRAPGTGQRLNGTAGEGERPHPGEGRPVVGTVWSLLLPPARGVRAGGVAQRQGVNDSVLTPSALTPRCAGLCSSTVTRRPVA